MAEQVGAKKKRVRAGHRSSTSRLIAQVESTDESPELNAPKMNRIVQMLKEKLDIIRKLDEEILEAISEEEEIKDEIEQADIYREKIDMAIMSMQIRIAGLERAETLPLRSHETQQQEPSTRASQQRADARDDVRAPSQEDHERTSSPEPDRSITRAPSVCSTPVPESGRGPRVKLPKVVLKRFDGRPTEWATFWDMFQSSVHNNPDLSDIDRFNYLHSLLDGLAANSISGLSLTSVNYVEAIAVLQKRFGNKQQVINKHMDALLELEAVSSTRDLKRLRHLYDQTEGHIRSLKSLGVPSESYGSLLAPILMKRLPHELCIIISKEVDADSWNVDEIMEIARKEIEARERASMNIGASTTQMKKPSSNRERATASVLVATSPTCYFCGEQHLATSCTKVTNPDARLQILLKAGRCFVCLKKGHISRECRSSLKCASCNGRHHSTICNNSRRTNPPTKGASTPSGQPQQAQASISTVTRQPSSNTPTVSLYVDMRTPVLLQTATTMVYCKNRPAAPIKARLILDSGSQKSYISAELRDMLNLPAEQTVAVSIKTFGSEAEKTQMCDVVKIRLATRLGPDLELTSYVVPFICEPLSGQPTDIAVERFQYLSGLDLADPNDSSENLPISILIGADYYWKAVTGRIIQGRVGPTAVQTRFGWVLSGPTPGLLGSTKTNALCSHILNVRCSPQEDCADLEKKLQAFWELDSLGIREDEDSVYGRFTRSITLRNGRYCVRLPWKESHPLLPDNFELSKARLFNLLKRLQRTSYILDQYDAVIRDQLKSGIVEMVAVPGDGTVGTTHYLPHHAVIREDKQTTKLRIVFDASARSNGPSLNDCLYAGPTFGQNILDILLRFRLYHVAVTADIEKAFLMVSVAEEDRDALRFLWLEDIKSHLPRLITLRFARVVFGVSSSPFLLNATLQHHMEHYRNSDPSFVNKFVRSIYVDDLTSGSDTEREALLLAKKARERLAEAGFNLRKFVTNSPSLQRHLLSADLPHHRSTVTDDPVTCDDESYTKNTLGDKLQAPECVKVLGVKWKPSEDELVFDLSALLHDIAAIKPTKRNIIGLSARIYDPLGILSPVTVQFKMLFQDICAVKLNWDEMLSGELLAKWNCLLSSLEKSQPLCIPRCYFNNFTSSTSCTCSLVGFCDASQKAYAAVVFLRMRMADQCVTHLVASKTRVAPLCTQTIPRLELLSALLLARLLSSITQAFKPEQVLDRPVCYTDSRITLYWIRRFDKEWKQFVQNRVNEVRSLVPIDSWYHCPGEQNPADLPSRGADMSRLIDNTLWINGPSWISDPGFEPQSSDLHFVPDECFKEIRVKDHPAFSFLTQSTSQVEDILNCEHFSTLGRLLKVTAYVMKFVSVLKTKIKGTSLTAEDIEGAEMYWVRVSQKMLTQDKQFGLWQQQLGLYCSADCIWRCGGRLQHADLPEPAMHPILLHKGHHFTELIVSDCHARVMHSGVKDTLTQLRSKYWVVKGRQFVRRLLNGCMACKRFSSRSLSGPTAPPLPDFRVRVSPPFSCAGVDYAGPLYLKNGDKVWICLFTCCVVRAVHLELVPDLTAVAFVRCLKRFSARRGIPQTLCSDNSKTFRSANKIISSILNMPETQQHFRDVRIQWTFILEKAPWWGGFYERMVQSMKRCLRKVIGKARMTFDELHTALVEVEAILNSRPISYVSSEDMDEPLTPSHLLLGHRLCTLPCSVTRSKDPEYGGSEDLSRRMQHLNQILEHFWKRWKSEYLMVLRERHAHSQKSRNEHRTLALGDVVLIYDADQPRTQWRIGRVEGLLEGSDGAVRGASLRVQSGKKVTLLNRPIQHLYPLETSVDAGANTCATDQASVVRDEEDTEPSHIAALNAEEPPGGGRNESRPQRTAAQVARYRLKELAGNPY